MSHLFSSESVTEGHPDKICDQISDAILDAVLEQDKYGRVACETAVSTGFVMVFGEISTTAKLDIPTIVRSTLRKIGYADPKYGFPADEVEVIVKLDRQSPDIKIGVDKDGAGDQGMMFGMAVDETKSKMPLPITLAHGLTQRLAKLRKSGVLPYLGPDGKAQISVNYQDNDELPINVSTVVVSNQHDADVGMDQIKAGITEQVVRPVLGDRWHDAIKLYINPTGKFVIGGPVGDAGLTGRKIIVDTYGGWSRHGGGAFSGKDPTKVDRSAAYMARYLSKNIVTAGLAYHVEIQLAYAIGIAKPVSLFVNTFGTGTVADIEIKSRLEKTVDLRPGAIIERLDLLRPIYCQTASYGHFGRDDLDLPWEKTDLADELRNS